MRLFMRNDLDYVLKEQVQKINVMAYRIPKEQFSNSSDQNITESIVAELEIEPLILHEEKIEKHEGKETKIDMPHHRVYNHSPSVDGAQFDADIPFEGAKWLFEYKTTTMHLIDLKGEVIGNKLRISISYPLSLNLTDGKISENLTKDFQQQLDILKDYVACSRKQVTAYNIQLPQLVEQAVSARREKINKVNSVKC